MNKWIDKPWKKETLVLCYKVVKLRLKLKLKLKLNETKKFSRSLQNFAHRRKIRIGKIGGP